jgi:hypothetical protein
LFLGFGDLDFLPLSPEDGHNCARELFVKGNLIFGGFSFWAAESQEIHLLEFTCVAEVRDIQQVWKLHQLPPKLEICGLMMMSLLCHSPKGRQSSHLLLVSKPGGFFDFSHVK